MLLDEARDGWPIFLGALRDDEVVANTEFLFEEHGTAAAFDLPVCHDGNTVTQDVRLVPTNKDELQGITCNE